MADKQLSKEYADKGWQITHAQPARTANDSPTGAAEAGHYIALKRDPDSNSLIEQAAQSLEQVEAMIDAWERGRPGDAANAPQPSEEQLRNSAEATLHMSVTSGARPAVDVDLTPAAKKATPKAIRLAVKPQVEEVKLDDATVAGIAEPPPSASKTTGVGDGTKAPESSTKSTTSRKK